MAAAVGGSAPMRNTHTCRGAMRDFNACASGRGIATARRTPRWVSSTYARPAWTWHVANAASSRGVAPVQKHSADAAPSRLDTSSKRDSGSDCGDGAERTDAGVGRSGVRHFATAANSEAGPCSCWTSQRMKADRMRLD